MPTNQQLAELNAELQRLRDENAEQRRLLEQAHHTLNKSKVWGGMEWNYAPLHPTYYKPTLEALANYLKGKA